MTRFLDLIAMWRPVEGSLLIAFLGFGHHRVPILVAVLVDATLPRNLMINCDTICESKEY